MKPLSLAFFFLMLVSAILFAAVYMFNQAFVETNPREFAIGLITVLVVGMVGMMNSIVSNVSAGKQRIR